MGETHHFRYWRYYSPDFSFGSIAELAFFEPDSISSAKGKVIGTEGSITNNPKRTVYCVFDDDPLTCLDAPFVTGCWAGLDLGKAVNIRKVRYLGRSDGNCIEIESIYELFYWNDDSWKSLGRVTADSTSLKYDNCPTNALFLLHNYSKGKEERIFTYENGEQVWW